MPTLLDRARLELYLQRLDHHLGDLPGSRRRQLHRELRANTQAAAAEVGLRQALANLGHPRALATGYLAAEGRRLPHYRKGAWWTVATLAVYLGAMGLYAAGFTDGAHAAGATKPVTTWFLGASIQADAAGSSWTVPGSLLVVGLLLVVYLLASRAWRALPPVRQRLAARWSHTPSP